MAMNNQCGAYLRPLSQCISRYKPWDTALWCNGSVCMQKWLQRKTPASPSQRPWICHGADWDISSYQVQRPYQKLCVYQTVASTQLQHPHPLPLSLNILTNIMVCLSQLLQIAHLLYSYLLLVMYKSHDLSLRAQMSSSKCSNLEVTHNVNQGYKRAFMTLEDSIRLFCELAMSCKHNEAQMLCILGADFALS